MIDAIIIDDEKSAIITLKNDLLAYCPEVNIRAVYTKAADALEPIRQNPPAVIFLDIDMPVMNGFDFIRALNPTPEQAVSSYIIFVSAYSEFAVRAFKVSALDYLLKPIDPSELHDAVQKVLDKHSLTVHQAILLQNFVNNGPAPAGSPAPIAAAPIANPAAPKDRPIEKIALPVNDGYNLVDPAHIIYCKAAGAYTEIVMDNEKSFLISKTLGRTQELMPPAQFERVHQSYLVNLRHIKKFRKGESPMAVMANDDVVKVSRVNKDRLAQLLGIK
jgi:two-component system, LytTR family, response regulator